MSGQPTDDPAHFPVWSSRGAPGFQLQGPSRAAKEPRVSPEGHRGSLDADGRGTLMEGRVPSPGGVEDAPHGGHAAYSFVRQAACPHATVHDPRRVRAPGAQARTRDLGSGNCPLGQETEIHDFRIQESLERPTPVGFRLQPSSTSAFTIRPTRILAMYNWAVFTPSNSQIRSVGHSWSVARSNICHCRGDTFAFTRSNAS